MVKKARERRYAKENEILRKKGISFPKILAWRQVFCDLLDTDMNGHMEDEDVHKIFDDFDHDMDEEDVADLHEYFGVGKKKKSGDGEEDGGEGSSKSEAIHSVSFVSFVLEMEKERQGVEGRSAKKCFDACFDMFKAKPKDKTLKKDDLQMGLQLLKVSFKDKGEFDEFFKKGKKSSGFCKTLSEHANFIDDEARRRKKKKSKDDEDAKKKKKNKKPGKDYSKVDMKSDPKYKKYFMLFKLRRGGRPGQAKAEAEADARGGALQKAEMNGIVGDELEALGKQMK